MALVKTPSCGIEHERDRKTVLGGSMGYKEECCRRRRMAKKIDV